MCSMCDKRSELLHGALALLVLSVTLGSLYFPSEPPFLFWKIQARTIPSCGACAFEIQRLYSVEDISEISG